MREGRLVFGGCVVSGEEPDSLFTACAVVLYRAERRPWLEAFWQEPIRCEAADRGGGEGRTPLPQSPPRR